MPETTISITAQDKYSPTINSIRNSHQHFNKDIDETITRIKNMEKQQEGLKEGLSKSQVKLEDSNKALKEAKKAYSELGDEVSRVNLEKAYSEVNKAKSEMQEWNQAIKDTQREMSGLWEDYDRQRNRAGDDGGILGSLASAGLTKMLGDSVSGLANSAISSAFGSTMGNSISTALSSAITGAAMGSIAGPIGTAIGGAVGLVSGGIQAATSYFDEWDGVFIDQRNTLVQSAQQGLTDGLDNGLSLAMSMEGNERRLTALSVGDADAFNNTLYDYGRTPPFSYNTAVDLAGSMLALGASEEEVLWRLDSLADAAVALKLSESGVSSLVDRLEQVQVNGTVDSRAFNAITKAGIDPYEAISETLLFDGRKISPDEVEDYLDRLDPDMFVDAMYQYMGLSFEGAAKSMAESFEGSLGILQSYQDEVDAAMAQGFMDQRTIGIQEETDSIMGERGERLKEANYFIGQFEAEQINIQERIARDIEDAVQTGNMDIFKGDFYLENFNEDALEDNIARFSDLASEYQQALAEENGNKCGEIMIRARDEAQIAYAETHGARSIAKSQVAIYEHATKALAESPALVNAAWEVGQAMQKGYLSGVSEDLEESLLDILSRAFRGMSGVQNSLNSDINLSLAESGVDIPLGAPGYTEVQLLRGAGVGQTGGIFSSMTDLLNDGPGNAWGLPYVPYDNYLTRLHEGERVLTAAEARNYGGSVNVTVSGNQFTIREEADVYKVAQEIVTQLDRAQQLS